MTTFICSRDPVGGDALPYTLAVDLARAGTEVTVFLVENGAFLARAGVCSELRAQLIDAGVEVLADDFALTERGILDDDLAAGVQPASLEVVMDHLAAGRKVTWH